MGDSKALSATSNCQLLEMAPMKAMKGGAKVLSKGALAEALAEGSELKKKDCSRIVEKLGEIAAAQVKGVGKFVVPGVAMVKTRLKPATKAGKREVFGKVVMVKARPARTVVKAFPVSALKKQFWGSNRWGSPPAIRDHLSRGPLRDELAKHP